MPAAADPAADTAPGIARSVLTAPVQSVEPALVALEAGPPDCVGGVGVHRRGVRDAGPRGVLEGVAVLQDAEALRALTRSPVGAQSVPWRACACVWMPVTHAVLPPPALLGGLG